MACYQTPKQSSSEGYNYSQILAIMIETPSPKSLDDKSTRRDHNDSIYQQGNTPCYVLYLGAYY